MPGISQASALTVIDQKLHRGLIPRQNYLWVGLSRFLEAVSPLSYLKSARSKLRHLPFVIRLLPHLPQLPDVPPERLYNPQLPQLPLTKPAHW